MPKTGTAADEDKNTATTTSSPIKSTLDSNRVLNKKITKRRGTTNSSSKSAKTEKPTDKSAKSVEKSGGDNSEGNFQSSGNQVSSLKTPVKSLEGPTTTSFDESVTPVHVNMANTTNTQIVNEAAETGDSNNNIDANNNGSELGGVSATENSNSNTVQTPGGSDWSPEFKKHPNRPISPFILLEETLKTPMEKKVFDEEIPELKDTLEFKFSQVKGTNDDEVSDADIISTVQFNEDGELLATGDKGGRIVIFKRDNPDTSEYNVYSTFQSHEPEFDYLKSLEIEEKINKIKWLPRRTDSHFLLSTNDKTIKLWKISERQSKVQGWNTKSEEDGYLSSQPEVDMDTSEGENSKITTLQVPKVVPSELVIESYPKKIYANAHTYHINSISCNSDAMTFLSADDLRVNVWNLESTNNSFNVVDIKPSNMEDLSEVITSAEFHPLHCHIFAYSSSRGTIRLCDMRESALCDNHKLLFEQEENPQERSFFSEIIASVSDIAFSPCGRYVLSRDYLTVKLWDLVNVGRGPVKSFPVHPFLSQKLCTLYENDCIFDKFEVCWSHDASNFMTGSYNNLFRVGNINTDPSRIVEEYSVNSPSHVYQATIDPNDLPSKRNEQIRPILQPKKIMNSNPLTKKKRNEICIDSLDYRQKVLHSDWHPNEHIIAVAATNRLLIYDSKNSPASKK